MSSTKPKSSWPASLRSAFRIQSLWSLSTSAILGLREDFKPPSLVTSSVDKATHLLTSSVRSWTTWRTVLLDRYAMLALTPFGNKELCSVGWQRRTASFKNSRSEKCTPTVTWLSLVSLALATYPLLGVLSKRASDGKGVWESWWMTCWNSGVSAWLNVGGGTQACSVHSCSAKLGRWNTIPWSWGWITTCAAMALARGHGYAVSSDVAQGPSGFWPQGPRPVLMLIITHLVHLVKRLNVVDQTCQLSAGQPEHTVVHFSGYAINGGKQVLKRRSLTHKRSAWVLTWPQDMILLAKNDGLTSDAIKLICFVHSLLLICCGPWQPIWVVTVPEGRWHGPITILNGPGSGGRSTWWCKMRVNTSSVGDKIFN